MAVTTIKRLDKLVFPTFELRQVDDVRWASGITRTVERGAGSTVPNFSFVDQFAPTIEANTPQVRTLLSAVPVNGLGVVNTNAYMKLATTTASVGRAVTTHDRITVTLGLLTWNTITFPHRGRARAQLSLAAAFDGVNDPFVPAGGVALPGSVAVDEILRAGPVRVNGTAIPGVQSIEVSSGVQLRREGGDGEEFPTAVIVESIEPVVTIQTLTPVNWLTLGLRGVALNGATGLEFFGRAIGSEAPFANAVASHLKGTALYGSVDPVDTSGDGTASVTDTLRVTCTSPTEEQLPLTFVTGTQIT